MTLSEKKENREGMRIFFVFALIYAAMFCLFFPRIFAYQDESIYLATTYLFGEGSIHIDQGSMPTLSFARNGEHMVPRYPPGNSVILLPWTLLGWRFVFFSGLLTHLIAAFFFVKLARDRGHSTWLASVLYLCLPTFVYFSRTIMADIPSLMFLMIGYYFYLKSSPKWTMAGFFMGASVAFRNTNALIILAFMIPLIWKVFREREWKPIIHYSLGVFPWILIIAAYHAVVFGSPLTTGYDSLPGKAFYWDVGHILSNLKHYGTHLMVAYPLMLVVFLFSKTIKNMAIILACFFMFTLFGAYFYYDQLPKRWMEAIFSARYIYPILPFFLLAYVEGLGKFWERFPEKVNKAIAVILSLILMTGVLGIHFKHQEVLRTQEAMKNAVYEMTEEGSTIFHHVHVMELLQKVWGERDYRWYEGAEQTIQAIRQLPSDQKIYLVDRSYQHGRMWLHGIGEEDFEKLGRVLKIRAIKRVGPLAVYEVSRK